MEKGGKSSAQLLELLQRAADELKTVRAELADTSARLEREERAHRATQEALQKARQELERSVTHPPLDQGSSDVTGEMPKLEEPTKALGGAVTPATDPTASAVPPAGVELERLRSELEAARSAHTALEMSVQAQAAEVERLTQAVDAEQKAHEATRSQNLAERHESASAFERQLVLSRQALNDARGQLEAERQKVQDLERQRQELGESQAALEARLGELEASVEAQVAKATEDALSRGQAAIAAAESALAEEKAKHQGTAQKLLAERQKGRELEAALAEARERIAALESAARTAADTHARMVAESEERLAAHDGKALAERKHFEAQVAQLTMQLNDSQTRLVNAVEEQRFVERKFQELHRELEQVMEQRDQLQRQLQATRR
ncbi:MAG: hypothetical protein K1X89_09750 [Myxococcaceae bacterium]|nr:hypothetical protein [Myxococcaceae bacterium]